MALLELVQPRPDWIEALGVALTRPAGVAERRAGEDPWTADGGPARPRRISDELAWLRQASLEIHDLQPRKALLQRLAEHAPVAAGRVLLEAQQGGARPALELRRER